MAAKREKRRYPRLKMQRPVILRHRGRLIPAMMENVSMGGMFVTSHAPEFSDFSNHFPIEVIFDLDTDHRDLSVRGNVVRVKNNETHQLGIQFTNFVTLSHEALKGFLSKNFSQVSLI